MTETKLTKEQMESVEAAAKKMMDAISEGKSSRDVMAQIYVEGLSDKTLKQGYVMADAMIDSVAEFDKKFFEAKNDVDGFLKSFQSEVDKDKSLAERCTYWRQFTAVISSACIEANDENGEGAKLTEEQLEALRVSEEEATAEYEAELHEQAIEAIKNSGVMLSGLMKHADAIEEAAGSVDAAELVVDLGTEDVNYRAIVSMLVYTKAKNGEFDNIPADMDLEQITTLVCAELEREKVMDEVGKGNLAVDVAAKILSILGVVVIVGLCAEVLVNAVLTTLVLCIMMPEILCTILTIPILILVVLGILFAATKGIKAWVKNSNKIVNAAICAVKTVVSGARMLASYVYEHVIVKIVPVCKQLLEKVKGAFKNAGEAVRRNETVSAQ